MTAKQQILIDIYNENRDQLYAHAEKFLRGNMDSDDVLNAALYACLKFAEEIKHPTAFFHFSIFQAAYPYILKTRYRDGRDELYRLFNPAEESLVDPVYSKNVEEDLSNELLEALNSLEPYEQTIVCSRVFHNMQFKEIAPIVGYSVTHTGQLYRNAMTFMWEQMQCV